MRSVKELLQEKVAGNISLTTVILVGAILIVSGMAVLSNAIDIAMSTKSYFNRNMADLRASTCIDEGMYKIAKQSTYTGTTTVNYADGNCVVVITNIGGDPTKKNLAITARYGLFTVTRTKRADTATTPISITN